MNSISAIPLADSWGMHGDLGTGWWIAMAIMMVLFWCAIILGIVWLARGGFGSWWPERREGFGWWPERRETPTEILDRRFAEGEISAEEYERRRDVITSGGRDNGAKGEAESRQPAQSR